MEQGITLKWHHGGINVKELDRSIRWYRDILGFHYVARDEIEDGLTIAWMEHNGFYLELFSRPDGPKLAFELENQSIGLRHLCLSLAPENFDALYQHFIKNAVEIERVYQHPQSEVGRPGGLRCMFVHDPDGNRIEFMEDFFPGAYGTNQPKPV